MELAGRRYIVTGAGRGMGRAVSDALAIGAARVAEVDREFERGSATDGHARERFGCDVARRSEVEAAFSDAVAFLGGLDGLVHCAGIQRFAAAEAISDESWDEMLDVNLRGTVLTNQAAFGHLKDRGGRIVNFGSDAGLVPAPHQAHYAASKGGVIAWSRSVAAEWGRYGITVNTVLPAVWTPMYEEYRAALGADEVRRHEESIAARMAIGDALGDPDRDLAPVVLFLLGDGSRFVTGQLISVTGGLGTTR